ncbi:MAG: GDSL-type esterase/lipase family protein [Rhodospirillales bacterium]|nr:GDSL-type esterase/lipase family protein [Rhodospirillales bacterium]
MTRIRICFVGDSITAGTGDTDYLGWPGRLCAHEARKGHDVTCYNLGVRAETSTMIAARWRSECTPRLPEGADGALVFSFGVNDMAIEEGKGQRVSREDSLSNARAVISEAKKWKPVLWLGPPPVVGDLQPLNVPGVATYYFDNARNADLSRAYASLAAELGVPYLEIFEPLSADGRWEKAQRGSDGIHAEGGGYALISDLIGSWDAWRAWFD